MGEAKKRKSVVVAALAFTSGTQAEASEYERHLLEKYVQGHLTIDEIIILLNASSATD